MRGITVVVALVCAAVLPSGAADAQLPPIELCQHAAMSGSAPINRHPDRFGEFYFDYVNAELGGIDGRSVSFTTFDDQFNPPTAVQAAERCKAQGADLLVGRGGRDQTVAVSKWAERNAFPYLHAATSARDIGAHTWSGGYLPADEEQASGLAGLLVANAEPDEVFGMIRISSPYYTAAHDAFVAVLRAHGYEPAVDEAVQKDDTNFGQLMLDMYGAGVTTIAALVTPTMMLRLDAQTPPTYDPLWAVTEELTYNLVLDATSGLRAVGVRTASPAYPATGRDTEPVDEPWATEIAVFQDIYDRYATPGTAARDDIDWESYLIAKQIHRFLLGAEGDTSPGHLRAMFSTHVQTPEASFPSCGLDFAASPGFGSHAWNVVSAGEQAWIQHASCVSGGVRVDFRPPAVSCGDRIQVVVGSRRCEASDPSGIGSWSLTVDGTVTAGDAVCAPLELDVPLGTGIHEVRLDVEDCAANPAAAATTAVAV